MNKQFLSKSLVLLSSILFIGLISACGNKSKDNKNEESNEEVEITEEKIQPRTVELSIFKEMPVQGDKSSYFTLLYPEGAEVLTLTGTPPEADSYSSAGVIKLKVDLKINKSLKDKVHYLSSNALALHFLDEDREDIGYITLGKTDQELVIEELEKANPGTLSLIYKGKEYDSSYNKIFDKAKYVRLENADFESEKEYEKSQQSSSSYSSSDNDTDSSYESYEDEDDSKSLKSAYKKAKEKVGSKAKDIKEKAAEKLNEWFDD